MREDPVGAVQDVLDTIVEGMVKTNGQPTSGWLHNASKDEILAWIEGLRTRVETAYGRVFEAMKPKPGEPPKRGTAESGTTVDDLIDALQALKRDGVEGDTQVVIGASFGNSGKLEFLSLQAEPYGGESELLFEEPYLGDGTAETPKTPEAPKGGDICGDNRFELIKSAKRELLRCTNTEISPDEMAVLDSLLLRMWQLRWLPGCKDERQTKGESK